MQKSEIHLKGLRNIFTYNFGYLELNTLLLDLLNAFCYKYEISLTIFLIYKLFQDQYSSKCQLIVAKTFFSTRITNFKFMDFFLFSNAYIIKMYQGYLLFFLCGFRLKNYVPIVNLLKRIEKYFPIQFRLFKIKYYFTESLKCVLTRFATSTRYR